MGEGLAVACLVIAELRFGNPQVLADGVAGVAVAVAQALQGVQDGSRPVVLAGKRLLAGGGSFEIEFGGELRMKNEPEAQAAINT